MRRGDPFSHPSGSSVWSKPKKLFGFFVLSFFSFIKRFLSLSFSSFFFRAHPATAGPENLQCRFAFIRLVRALVSTAPVFRAPASNTLLTRDTVESPAKLFPSSSTSMLKFMERHRLQSVLRAGGQHLHLAVGCAQKILKFHSVALAAQNYRSTALSNQLNRASHQPLSVAGAALPVQ